MQVTCCVEFARNDECHKPKRDTLKAHMQNRAAAGLHRLCVTDRQTKSLSDRQTRPARGPAEAGARARSFFLTFLLEPPRVVAHEQSIGFGGILLLNSLKSSDDMLSRSHPRS